MKAIGHTDGGTKTQKWSSTPLTDPLSPHTLYIPEPGMRENIDADQFEHVGWINPDQSAGKIYSTHANAAEYGDARPAYIRRVADDKSVYQDGPHFSAPGPTVIYNTDPMDVRRSEFDALVGQFNILEAKFNTLARIQQHGSLTQEPPMTFYDHAFIAAFMDLRPAMSSSYAIEQAHSIAGQLTRNRANKP